MPPKHGGRYLLTAPRPLYHVEVLAAQVADAPDIAPARPHRALKPGVRPLLADDAWGEPVAPCLVLGHYHSHLPMGW